MKVVAWIGNILFVTALGLGFLAVHFASGLSFPIDFPAYWQAFVSNLGFGVPDAAHLVPTIGLIVFIILFLVEFFGALKLIARFRQVLMGVVVISFALVGLAVSGFLLTIYCALPKPIELVPAILIYISLPLEAVAWVLRSLCWYK